ncbi:amino acid adenylation domain-containing protein [Rhodoblastus acidophilus]|uniref:amino acid adenylation domain-containing protein n=1 Tax=Rhodoblastus acidophilus TaxID=1074 RepID=UPI002223FD5E|nr:amino acid adenylation domain-containing protein [Rhodoblastus acidophilus]MCW2283820.1 amino acid adenylation domain-containing protein [Rhodoblastus acidophilus]MCW2332831.1 amino acid adenylation domain-containing protein [Rhodoblastus acidophilus]
MNITVIDLMKDTCARFPERMAVLCEEKRLSYQDLDRASNKAAHFLLKKGVRKGDRVVLVTNRSLEAVIVIAAILKAGASYVPLEPGAADETHRFALRDSAPSLVIVEDETDAFDGVSCVGVDDVMAKSQSESDEPLEIGVSASDPAYIMYTSGSTGRSKGVIVPHRGIVRLVQNPNFMQLDPSVVMLHAAPLAFDASTLEVWGPLSNGGCVTVLAGAAPSIDQIARAIRDYKVDTLWLTAGLFHLFIDERPEALRPLKQMLAGGDVLSPSHLQRALALLPDCTIINGYGPTENTTFSCCYPVPRGGWGPGAVPIGYPISGTSVHILTDTLEPVSDGEEGQLCVGGDGVALGYLNLPELTVAKFVADPFSSQTGAKLYLTGDFGRRRSDGAIEFLGRRDRQVKINGMRVELDGIEQALRDDPRIADAAVVITDANGFKRVVAFIKPVDPTNSQNLSSNVLHDLKARLPSQMVPSEAVIVPELPLNANGKVDRIRLIDERMKAAAEFIRPDAAAREEPSESVVYSIWRELLRGAFDHRANLFDLGATSLQMIAAHERIQAATGVRFPLTAMFAHPNVAAFEAFLAGKKQGENCDSASDRGQRQRAAMMPLARRVARARP